MLSLTKHLLKNCTVTLSEVEGALEGKRVGLRFFTSFRMTMGEFRVIACLFGMSVDLPIP
ncbi:hypothetical protein AVO42_11515 [Thiomicrospira sp. XS5]|nr:hypothetical protein AVO42_11515 [Thiomicrospira sp. XS5]